jgi:hypothetical protein
MQPGGEGAVATEGGERLPGAHEGVLGQLLGPSGVAGEAQGEGIDPPVVLPVQLLEGARIAPLGPCHQQFGDGGDRGGDRLGAVQGGLHRSALWR